MRRFMLPPSFDVHRFSSGDRQASFFSAGRPPVLPEVRRPTRRRSAPYRPARTAPLPRLSAPPATWRRTRKPIQPVPAAAHHRHPSAPLRARRRSMPRRTIHTSGRMALSGTAPRSSSNAATPNPASSTSAATAAPSHVPLPATCFQDIKIPPPSAVFQLMRERYLSMWEITPRRSFPRQSSRQAPQRSSPPRRASRRPSQPSCPSCPQDAAGRRPARPAYPPGR